jgi:hypothetical protein
MLYKPPQLSIELFYLCCSHQFDMSYPYCYLGQKCQLKPSFDDLTMKCTTINGGMRQRPDTNASRAPPPPPLCRRHSATDVHGCAATNALTLPPPPPAAAPRCALCHYFVWMGQGGQIILRRRGRGIFSENGINTTLRTWRKLFSLFPTKNVPYRIPK